jgi:hypothetical protein
MPLRPELYERLRRRLGPVRIIDEDCPMTHTVEYDALTGRPRLEVDYAGEYLATNCPFCGDTRQRLWVNHRWGWYDPATRSRNLWLAVCYNEHCLEKPGRSRELYAMVFSDVRNGRLLHDKVLKGPPKTRRRDYEPPGATVPVHQLPIDHPAVAYLRGRGFDAAVLGPALGLAYCAEADPRFQPAEGRIIIPIEFGGKPVGWQARYVGESPHRAVLKYWTMPGLHKSRIVYNHDRARAYPFVVLCEGAADVWRAGPWAVAPLGKGLSAAQKRLIGAGWGGGAAVVLLDGDAAAAARAVYDDLAGVVRGRVLVGLPEDQDPADLPFEELWERVRTAASEQGVALGPAAHVPPGAESVPPPAGDAAGGRL